MGQQLSAGDSGIHYTLGSQLVVAWCERFDKPVKPENITEAEWMESRMGSTTFSVDTIRTANAEIPSTYLAAKQCGFCEPVYRGEITERDFAECRAFLRYAAEGGHEIRGSY